MLDHIESLVDQSLIRAGAAGEGTPPPGKFEAITWPEIAGTSLLVAATLIVGVWPKVLLDSIEPAVKALLAGGMQ